MQRMVGNAVPSLIAEILAREIRNQLLGTPITLPLKLIPQKKEITPQPEDIVPLAEKYQALIGDHDDHPGTGKGNQAVKRVQVA